MLRSNLMRTLIDALKLVKETLPQNENLEFIFNCNPNDIRSEFYQYDTNGILKVIQIQNLQDELGY
jgi:hypothetical protein